MNAKIKSVITALILLATLIPFASCSAKTSTDTSEQERTGILVAYFSAQGHTKDVAEKIANVTGGDLFEIEPVDIYTEEDLDGWNESARGTRESKDRSTRPEIANRVDNFERYDTIYLGFPIWWFTAPTIVNTFLESYDTEGKTIIPFATSGGSSYGDTEKDLRVSAPKAVFKPGKVLNGMDEQQIRQWIKSLK
jgi:flavodoxin